jgi:hypothetical protein
MKQVTFKIAGVSRDATVTWNNNLIGLNDLGGGNFAGSVQSDPGIFVYAIVVFGSPGDAWTASVSADGSTTFNHSGHMSPGGFDTTGDTAFEVK